MVYDTCSLEPEENEQMVDAFGGRHPNSVMESQPAAVQPRDSIDGAFVVRWRKANPA